jgi:hypothetical protein
LGCNLTQSAPNSFVAGFLFNIAVYFVAMAVKKLSVYSPDYPPASYNGEDELFIHMSMDRVDVLVRSGIKNIPEALEVFHKEEDVDWPETLKSILRQSELLRRNFSERHIAFSFPDALVIPEAKFSSSSTKDLINLIYGEQSHSWIGYKKMPRSFEMMLAYRIEEGIHDWISERFPSYDTTHLYAEILLHELGETIANEKLAFIHLEEQTWILTLLSGGKLQVIQTFKYTTSEDILYDLLNGLQQCQIPSNQCRLKISGQLTVSDELVDQLSGLFQSIEWKSIPAAGVFQSLKQQFPPHHFYLLQRWLL